MSGPRMVPAFCAGHPVEVAVRPGPIDACRVPCPSCGAKRGDDCFKIGSRTTQLAAHASRLASAVRSLG